MFELIFAAALLFDPTPKQAAVLHTAAPAAERASATPPVAALMNVAVTLECTARADGQVEDCKVLGETHPGLGFGEAAIALMRDAEVAPGPRDVQFARTIQFVP